MDPEAALAQLGGTCSWRDLRRTVPRHRIHRALGSGAVVRVARGRYALPGVAAARVVAVGAAATASHTTAALHWGWAVKREPDLPHLTLPRGRKLRDAARTGVHRHWRDLSPDEVCDGWVTSATRTVLDCALDLPFDEALAVADSAWRAGVSPVEVMRAALPLPRRVRRRAAAVLVHADRRAANPFESVLRALCLRVDGLTVRAQRVIRDRPFYARVDLADPALGIVVEAEGFEFHGHRAALERDCRRYTGLASRGWVVIRFTWHEVMFEPDYVIESLRAVVAVRSSASSRRTATKLRPARLPA
jgi:very-short-patch-repair endonuclease